MIQQDLKNLFHRDLNRLVENIEATPEEQLWQATDGVTNSCGVLAQHLVGNLNHYIGAALGNTGYKRDREREFKTANTPKVDLIEDIKELQQSLNEIFDHLQDSEMEEDFPVDIPFEFTTQGFLLHLYGHLNYHLGQINYLRRLLASK
ncbi:MAG TPA: DinB family protein [Bacteroidales bacterium]|nr:DinB family protein [Bacteroidales bacterium]